MRAIEQAHRSCKIELGKVIEKMLEGLKSIWVANHEIACVSWSKNLLCAIPGEELPMDLGG